MAAAALVLITGRGAVGPTGVAMPPITEAGACIGTRLPATSDCVEIGWVVVFASLTKSVNRWSPSHTASDAPHPGPLPVSGEGEGPVSAGEPARLGPEPG